MFEDALMESGGKVRSGSRWTTTVSFTMQAAILLALVLYARFGPHPLLVTPIDMKLRAPAILPPPLPQVVRVERMPSAVAASEGSIQAPVNVSVRVDTAPNVAPPAADYRGFADLGSRSGPSFPVESPAIPAANVKSPAPPGPRRVSAGIVQANCISCPQPNYPAVARAVHESGTVVLDAVISRNGMIENLQVVSGPQLLRKAALDAVRNWRYKPTVLSGQPVEVQAEINVVFNLQ
jgi:periplasmic protein TonB